MPISEKTLAEMEAGALALAKSRGETELSPGYLEAIVRTQMRYNCMRAWEKEGKITIEPVILDNTRRAAAYKLIHCGDVTFDDRDAESRGAYPSEVLIANIALALSSGVHKAKAEDYR